MKLHLKHLLPLVFILAIGCSGKFIYTGQNYPITSHAEVYLNEEDVPEAYEVIGTLKKKRTSVIDIIRIEKLYVKMAELAKKHGGDAVLMTEIMPADTTSTSPHEQPNLNDFFNQMKIEVLRYNK